MDPISHTSLPATNIAKQRRNHHLVTWGQKRTAYLGTLQDISTFIANSIKFNLFIICYLLQTTLLISYTSNNTIPITTPTTITSLISMFAVPNDFLLVKWNLLNMWTSLVRRGCLLAIGSGLTSWCISVKYTDLSTCTIKIIYDQM